MIAAIDIGNFKTVALVGKVDSDGELHIAGAGVVPSKGVKRGVVINIESTTQAIREAVREAELMADCTIDSCFVGLSGSHIESIRNSGMVTLSNQEVSSEDISRVIEAARTTNKISSDRLIVHKIPQDFTLDGQDDIPDPIGMAGLRLEANVHLITCPRNILRNLEKCINGCGIQLESAVLSSYAESFAVLKEDQKDFGVCLIKVGGGTTDISVFLNGTMYYANSIAVGGSVVTNDIALALRTPPDSAEEIKTKYACALRRLARDDDVIKVPSVDGREPRDLRMKTLIEFVEPRYEQIFSLVQEQLRDSGLDQFIGAGIVLTGGASTIQGAVELAEEIFQMPVSMGYPSQMKGMGHFVDGPAYATSVGLLLYGIQQQKYHENEHPIKKSSSSALDKLHGWLRQW